MKSGPGPGGSNGLVSSHPKCLIFQEVEETSLSFLPNRQLHSVSDLASTPSAALKLRREIKRESWDALILRSNTRTLKLPLPWTPYYASGQLLTRLKGGWWWWLWYHVTKLHLEAFHRIPFTRCQSLWQPEMGKLGTWTFRTLFHNR